jgi:hypothetical protein
VRGIKASALPTEDSKALYTLGARAARPPGPRAPQGLNDKVALLDGVHGNHFFGRPINEYVFNFLRLFRSARLPHVALEDGRARMTNAEQYLHSVLAYHQVPTRQVAAEVLPAIISRLNPAGEVCLAPEKLANTSCISRACAVRCEVFRQLCGRRLQWADHSADFLLADCTAAAGARAGSDPARCLQLGGESKRQ